MTKQKQFVKDFSEGLEMWTSEDGTLLSVCITRRSDWAEVLQFQSSHLFAREKFDPARGALKFATREWRGKEFFDGGSGMRGKVWVVTDDETEFPIIEYKLQFPR